MRVGAEPDPYLPDLLMSGEFRRGMLCYASGRMVGRV